MALGGLPGEVASKSDGRSEWEVTRDRWRGGWGGPRGQKPAREACHHSKHVVGGGVCELLSCVYLGRHVWLGQCVVTRGNGSWGTRSWVETGQQFQVAARRLLLPEFRYKREPKH